MVGTIRSPEAINMIHGNERREKVEQMKIQWMLNRFTLRGESIGNKSAGE